MARASKATSVTSRRRSRSNGRPHSKKADLRAIHRARILIVAKDPQTMSDMQHPEVAGRHEIEIALNPDVAMTILAERHMDVLALDTTLSGAEDADCVRSVREDHPTLPISAIGDKKTKTIEKRLKKAGANYYMVRPLESGAVTRTIGRALVRAAQSS